MTLGDIAGIYAADQNFVSGIVAAIADTAELGLTLVLEKRTLVSGKGRAVYKKKRSCHSRQLHIV
jgi:hypothetical protein